MKRMLINATQSEERRLAIVDGQKLLDYEIEIEGREQRKGNIYKGVVTRVEQSLEACFVDYGEDRQGFLPFKEISKQYFSENISPSQARINEVIREGQELLVQVEKEERGNKGAALTTFVSLAGRYVVLMPNNPRGGGVSRRIEGEQRAELKEAMDQLDYPKGMSIIARTAGIGRSAPELQWDLNYLLKLWSAIDGAAKAGKGAFLIYQESSLVIRAIRDYFSDSISDILIDTDDIYEQAQQFMAHVMPEHAGRVKRYRDDPPLFSRFQIEHQIESAYSRTVTLPSGGAIVIDHTEALVSVDVNSARAIKGGDIEETARNTNLEAADEVARQMRLRDLGGLIVIDFIDMEDSKNRREVEIRLKDALKQDRARVQFGTISKFGLMEMSRQRLKPALSEGAHINCPRCGGSGHIRDTESSALQILRIIQEESMKDNTAAVHCQVPVEVASFLLNEKRSEITKIQLKQNVKVTMVPNKSMDTPHYKLERLKHDDARLEAMEASYKLAEDLEEATTVTRRSQEPTNKQTPIIKGVLPDAPAPIVEPRPTRQAGDAARPQARPPVQPPARPVVREQGFLAWLKNFFGFGSPAPVAAPAPVQAPQAPAAPAGREPRRGERNERNEGRDNRDGRGARRNERSGERNERTNADRGQERSYGNDRGNERNGDRNADRNGDRNERNDRRNPRNNSPRDGEQREGRNEQREPRNDQRNDQRERNDQRGRRGERSQERREDQVMAQDAQNLDMTGGDAVVQEARGERAPRQDRGDGRRSRGPRQGQNDNPTDLQADAQFLAAADSMQAAVNEPASGEQPTDDNGQQPRQRRSRDRYGRDRRNGGRGERSNDGSGEQQAFELQDDQAVNEPPAMAFTPDRGGESAQLGEATTAAADDAPARRSYFDAVQSPEADASQVPPQAPVAPAATTVTTTVVEAAATAVAIVSPATAAQAQVPAEPTPSAAVAAAAAPVTATANLAQATDAAVDAVIAVSSVSHQAYHLPLTDLEQLATASGLQWVNSNPEKIAQVQAAIAAEPRPVHVPRERPPVVVIDDSGWQLVETIKDLKTLPKVNEASEP